MELTFKSYYLTQDGVNGCDGQNASGRNINIPTNSFVKKYATSVDIDLKLQLTISPVYRFSKDESSNNTLMIPKKGLETIVLYARGETSKAHIVNVSCSWFNLQVCMI